MVLSGHNLPQPTQAQLTRGEFPETLSIEQGVVLSFRFVEWTVRWTSHVLWKAVEITKAAGLSNADRCKADVSLDTCAEERAKCTYSNMGTQTAGKKRRRKKVRGETIKGYSLNG